MNSASPLRTRPIRIAVTGGPGGGKSTAADLFRREIGSRVALVPEAATTVFACGFPRSRLPEEIKIIQRAIFQMQHDLEDLYQLGNPGCILLCDRGTVDGAAYWPGSDPRDFFIAQGTTLKRELARYGAVLFLESAAIGGLAIDGGNPFRNEALPEAVEIDQRLRALWSKHPRFVLVPNNPSFFKKIAAGLAAMEQIVKELEAEQPQGHKPGKSALKRRKKR